VSAAILQPQIGFAESKRGLIFKVRTARGDVVSIKKFNLLGVLADRADMPKDLAQENVVPWLKEVNKESRTLFVACHTPAAVKSAWESLTKTVDWRKGFTHKDLAAVLMPDVECCPSVQTNVCEQLMRTPLYCRHFMEVMQNQVRSQHRWREKSHPRDVPLSRCS
jgi:hypothetical protein